MLKRLVKPFIALGLMVMLVVGSGSSAFAADTLVDDSHPGWGYSGYWRPGANVAGAINGTLHSSNVVGSEATLTCRVVKGEWGAPFATTTLYYSKAYNRGITKIWATRPGSSTPIDGYAYLDMYAPGVTRQQSFTPTFWANGEQPGTYMQPGDHFILHIQVSGQRNAASSDIFTDIDAVFCDRP